MKNAFIISLLVLLGISSISATKSDKLLGKWQAYETNQKGRIRDTSKDKYAPWIEFYEDNLVWLGEGKKNKRKGEWFFEDDTKTLYLEVRQRKREMKILRLTKKKMILYIKSKDLTVYWKKVS